MNRNIIIAESDFDKLYAKLSHITAISELLISDMGNSHWADETVLNSISAISTISNEMQDIITKRQEIK
ncbi:MULTISPECIES: hypothetical protein [unclassified Gilliamella]|nr:MULTISPECIES: hypothetical protein [Gilliamella]MCX8642952.1 hypothetical protein [Gilliamella sp. B3835]MCX8708276.1 hypothetical protein [Gilliamella sp. B3783]MCX8709433.1 hypothetical protein [Gilliamella sp. B3780]MCX8711951.1 hypothetical protein [Gilliamella sp. B3468]MCX8714217.1 hypothetical protein [Gilliamella sp. B3781]